MCGGVLGVVFRFMSFIFEILNVIDGVVVWIGISVINECR